MTEAQQRFCDEYLIDFNATRAYKVAYPSTKKDETVNAAASRLLRNVKVQAYLTERKKILQENTGITQERVLKQIANIAFGDIRKLYNEAGGLKNIQDIDDETAAMLVAIDSFEEFEGYGDDREQIGYTKKIKIADKTKALDMLGKYFGMFKDKVEINQDKPFEVNITVKKSDTKGI